MNTESSVKTAFWIRHIEAWKDRGVSIVKYCETESLSRSAFGYWRKKLSAPKPPADGFLKLKVPAHRSDGMIYIRLRTGIEIGIVSGTEVRYVAELVGELERS
tara:strand:- start:98 stop:406 length:309 start_codon:yes stop_codon:yes gene_type:complete